MALIGQGVGPAVVGPEGVGKGAVPLGQLIQPVGDRQGAQQAPYHYAFELWC